MTAAFGSLESLQKERRSSYCEDHQQPNGNVNVGISGKGPSVVTVLSLYMSGYCTGKKARVLLYV